MKQAEAIEFIRRPENTREILESWCGRAKLKTSTGEPEYICPICGHGAGDDATGDGLVFNPKSKGGHGLKCFKCNFSGDVIDLYMNKTGENFPRAVESLARRLGVVIDKEYTGGWNSYAAVRADFDAIIKNGKQKQAARAALVSAGGTGAVTSTAGQNTGGQNMSTGNTTGPAGQSSEDSRLAADIAAARANINTEEARSWISKRGLGLDKAGRIFAPEYNLGFTNNWRGNNAPRLLIPTGPASYFLRDLRPDGELTEVETRHAKKDKGEKNIFNAAALLTGEPVFITEGEIDALSIIEVGGGLQAVGLGGISEINKLMEFIRAHDVTAPLIVSLDSDGPGRKAAGELCEALRKDGRRWILNNISGPFKDPNERLQKDRDGLRRIVENAGELARLIPLPVKEKAPGDIAPGDSTPGTADTPAGDTPQGNLSPALIEQPAPVAEPQAPAVNERPRPTVGLTVLSDFVSDLSVGSWLIDRWLPAGGLSMVFGDPGAFKSFFALDMALTLASGAGSWKGNPVRRLEDSEVKPAVVYLAGEGHASLKERTLAWIKNYNETEQAAAESAGLPFEPVGPEFFDTFYFSQRSLDMFNHGETQAIIDDIKALGRPVELIVIDTLARFFHGDENSAQDAGQLIGACAQLQDIFGAAVMLIHHAGVAADSKNRSRGSSAFLGGLDTQIKLELLLLHEDGGMKKVICASQKKQKNITEAPDLWLEPQIISLDGFVNPLTLETISTAVLVPRKKHVPENQPAPVESEPEKVITSEDLLRGDW